MSLNHTPSANRIHIGFFGRRNAGKSSVVNAVTGQNLAIVSDMKGTTTDPVFKAMELLPLGPVMIIDTPGLDDEGELGKLRVQKSYQVLNKTDIAVLVVDATIGRTAYDEAIIESFQQKNIPYLVVYNKLDLCSNQHSALPNEIWVSAETRDNIAELKELIAKQVPQDIAKYPIVSDLILPMDFVVLVVPIDSAAPKGRLILPQQQTIREVLEAGAAAIAVKETELQHTLNSLGKKPKLVITDSQAFKQVSEVTPKDILLTSFSILFARHKGSLEQAVMGAKAVDSLCDGDAVLISEGCTHHRQCEDIGTVKLPKWITDYTRKALKFEFTSGTEFPKDLQKYKLVIHCGGCMLNEREMKYRLQCAEYQNVPITNYGILIAYIHGILQRSIEVFPNISALL
ncbi:iron-only hydrogenase maturation protein HydF [Hydrogenoanaerobacterium saccharovorans]|uniref:Iron-only hydrogenase maturation protein HydF n=1 Tax=Hydrogenoanaerobacterium saccharovorans TaxID=474960 RepID=A0A1H7YTS2_9FIRM|nr:[FeFe] hydrogenase H-cluster maturation GTPase HydF [Hydrogenoanaerobacterium saccharovorans]RPF49055.1 iron-only hydrogenase maturation protein HydF [Hydrogenoanaerobacterium saccharovorans]SEM48768.1 iron-only hydrogenase maturation protein HydF [Hydrogenoanaerobacterium saccharovorans]